MKWSWVWLVLSTVSTCAGLTMVLVFSQLLVVPHRSIRKFVHTQCEVLQVTLEKLDTRLTQEDVYQSKCVYVRVSYKHLGGGHRVGPLYLDTHTYDNRHQMGKCMCSRCSIEIVPGNQTNQTSSIAIVESHILAPGNLTDCYYRPYGGRDILQWRLRTENKSIVNAMLWPSLLFIGGFVGLFFSCLAVQEEQNGKRGSRRKDTNTQQPSTTKHTCCFCCPHSRQSRTQSDTENI